MKPERTQPSRKLAPREYFAPGEWPDGLPSDPEGDAALFAAAVCIFVRQQLDEGESMQSLEQKTGVAYGQLRHVLSGDRWIGLETVARLELTFKRTITGYDAMNARIADARNARRKKTSARRARVQGKSAPTRGSHPTA